MFLTVLFLLFNLSFADQKAAFHQACSGADLSQRPATGLFVVHAPLEDKKNQTTTYELLVLQYAEIMKKLESSKQLQKNLKYCLQEGAQSESCSELLAWIDHELPHHIKRARFHLLLAQSPYDPVTWMKKSRTSLNESMSLWGVFKETSWQRPDLFEMKAAQEVLEDYKKGIEVRAIQKIMNGEIKSEQLNEYKELTLLSARYQHFLEYRHLLSQVHLLQHLSKRTTTHEEILSAVEKSLNLLKKEEDIIAEQIRSIQINHERGRLEARHLALLDYATILEEVLFKNPQYCALATSLVYHKENRKIAMSIAVGLPLLAVSFYLPPALALVSGVATGGAYVGYSQSLLNDETSKYLGHVYGDGSAQELDQMSEAKRSRDVSILTAPVGLGLFSAGFSQTSKIALEAFRTSQKIFKTAVVVP